MNRNKHMPLSPVRILLYGAFDRMNYGDLLYPVIMTEFVRAHYCNVDVSTYGFVEADLSLWGGIGTMSLRQLYDDADTESVILMPGGEILAQSWYHMYLYTSTSERAGLLSEMCEEFGEKLVEKFITGILSARHSAPWILSPSDFARRPRIAYHSVGGWPLALVSGENRKVICDAMEQALWVTTRDLETQRLVAELSTRITVHYAPDSAFLLPKVWPSHVLEAKLPNSVSAYRSRHGYFAFQANGPFVRENLDVLVQQICRFRERAGIDIVFVPIGRCTNHRDIYGLSELAERTGSGSYVLPETASLQETAAVIANARIATGTSLHFLITALTYGTPILAFHCLDPKVKNNMLSWGCPQQWIIAHTELADAAAGVIDSSLIAVREMSTRLQLEAERSLMALLDLFAARVPKV